MICYLIEYKNDNGNLTGTYVGISEKSLLAAVYNIALKFADRLSAERFRLWIHGEHPDRFNLANIEVTEHEEV